MKVVLGEYIERSALIKKLFPYGMPDNGNYGINAKAVRVAVERAPAADVVEVVRCKDCKLYYDGDMGRYCQMTLCAVETNDFCSYGERKDNG